MNNYKIHDFNNFKILQHTALEDNYNYILFSSDNRAILIDPSDSDLTLYWLGKFNLNPEKILLTHHHIDHIGGVNGIKDDFNIPVYGFELDSFRMPVDIPLTKDATINWENLVINIIHTPGHTIGHIVYYIPQINVLFCGDLIFPLGCGRLFEGSYNDLLTSLTEISKLPIDTQIFCAHEYAKINIPFATFANPENIELKLRVEKINTLLSSGKFTVPSSLGEELKTNPFFGYKDKKMKEHHKMLSSSDLDFLTFLRSKRNNFTC